MKSSLLPTLRLIPDCQPTGAVAAGFAYGEMGVWLSGLARLGESAQSEISRGDLRQSDLGLGELGQGELSIHPTQKWSNLDRSTQSGRSRRNPTST